MPAESHPPSPPDQYPRLAPVLGLFTATTLVIGQVIGLGIFLKPKPIAESTGGYVGLILALWILCGLVNLCGALTLSELSAMYPQAGGCYVYLRHAYGRIWGFVWGWAEFWVIRSGAIAALASATALSLVTLWAKYQAPHLNGNPEEFKRLQMWVALVCIVYLTLVNVARTQWSGVVQNVTTLLKIASLLFLAALPWFVDNPSTHVWQSLFPSSTPLPFWLGIGTALAGIMWAYDGWGQVTVVAEEIRDPQRNVPRALTGGLVGLILLYTLVNLGYHMTLSSDEIIAANIPAAAVANRLLRNGGESLLIGMLAVSAFGALNSNILVGPRVLFAVARDHRFMSWLERIDPRTGTPALAIGCVSFWSCVLLVAGDRWGDGKKALFDVLTDYAIFGGSLFYFAAVVSVFVLRHTQPDMPRPYRTWGYPWVPAIFTTFYVFLLVSMFVASPVHCTVGLAFIVSGVVVYLVAVRQWPDAPLPAVGAAAILPEVPAQSRQNI